MKMILTVNEHGNAKMAALLTNTINYVSIAMFKALRNLDEVKVEILGRERSARLNWLVKWLPYDLAHEVINSYRYVFKSFLTPLKLLKGYDLVINTRSNETCYLHTYIIYTGYFQPAVREILK